MVWEGDRDKFLKWLDKNPDKINEQTYWERKTVLMIAVWHTWDIIVKILLHRGADLKIQNQKGETAIDIAASLI